MLRVGIDVGGTFTDFIAWQSGEAGGTVKSYKVPSTPPNFQEGFVNGLTQVLADFKDVENEDLLIIHGTTIATNTVIERSAAPVALLTTRGFRDILNIQRLRLRNPTNLFEQRPETLVPRQLVFEVSERMLHNGEVRTPINPEEVVAVAHEAISRGAKGFAVAFYHSYRNPAHEEIARDALLKEFGNIDVSVSSEIWPQIGEYERAMAAVLNAYVKPRMGEYITAIEEWLLNNLPNARLYITRSNGGAMSVDGARRFPVQTLLSGPASGVTAALATAGRLSETCQYLTFDMGGTSTDVSLIRDSSPMTSTTSEVGDFPVSMPVTDIEAIGAGGGSLIGFDNGVLRVGPKSAGARPGPASFGRGGTEPTVSDAYLLAGYVNPENFLGGRIRLDADAAAKAMKPVAEALGQPLPAAAEAALDVATSNMVARVMPYMARHGVDPEDVTLVAFGGAGPLHAPLLAQEMGIQRVLIPPTPSVFCASGGLVTRLVNDSVLTVHGQSVDGAALKAGFVQLDATARKWLAEQAHPEAVIAVHTEASAEARYIGQSFQIEVKVPEAAVEGDLKALLTAFHDEHERLYNHSDKSSPVEILQLRLRILGELPNPPVVAGQATGGAEVAQTGERSIYLDGQSRAARVYTRERLPHLAKLSGPAIIEEKDSTVLVPHDYVAMVNEYGDIVLTKE